MSVGNFDATSFTHIIDLRKQLKARHVSVRHFAEVSGLTRDEVTSACSSRAIRLDRAQTVMNTLHNWDRLDEAWRWEHGSYHRSDGSCHCCGMVGWAFCPVCSFEAGGGRMKMVTF